METGRKLNEVRTFLREFYGKRVKNTTDLIATACYTDETRARFYEILKQIPEEVTRRQYGCGSPIPRDDLSGLTVVDLGSGAGTDAFVLSKLVGPKGHVFGIDMTEEQLEVARRNTPPVMGKFGHAESNVAFLKDYIEVVDEVEDQLADLVISNCVINLSPRKDLVFKTIHRILKEGGEFYISDIACDRRPPKELQFDERLYSECLTGAEYIHDLMDIMEEVGFRDVRIVEKAMLEDSVGKEAAKFCSITLRGFKLTSPSLDRRCEDYGQIATYKGNCANQPVEFKLDEAHVFETGRPAPVCRNTALMLSKTRLGRYFEVTAEVKHFGIFDCKPEKGVEDVPAQTCCV